MGYTPNVITLNEARRQADALAHEAAAMVAQFGIVQHLAALGDVEQRGSSVHELMVRRDVDFNVYAEEPLLARAADVARNLIDLPDMYGVQINNLLLRQPPPGMPRGIYLGIKPMVRGQIWTIDAWYLRKDDALDQIEFGTEWWGAVSPAQRDAMLVLKATLQAQGRYGKEFLSAEIYRAVRDGGVATVAELERWHVGYMPH